MKAQGRLPTKNPTPGPNRLSRSGPKNKLYVYVWMT